MIDSPHFTEGRIYPIKSCGGITFSKGDLFPVTAQGPLHDREWLVTSPDGQFRTQRDDGFEKLALVQPSFDADRRLLVLKAPHMEIYRIPLFRNDGNIIQAEVWNDRFDAVIDDAASEWMSEFLTQHCLLVRKSGERLLNRPTAPVDARVSAADRYHMLGISEETLATLNELLPKAVPMNRFRPNLVFSGGNAHQENTWKSARIGPVEISGVKPCERCNMTDVDQATAARQKIVLKTLMHHFKGFNGQPIFGENFIVRTPGNIVVGDSVKPIESYGKSWDRAY